MCLYGNYLLVEVNYTQKENRHVAIDACIAKEIYELNKKGVQTVGCCCSHGDKEYNSHVLFLENSVSLMEELGYRVEKYCYKDGKTYDIYIANLKTGCNTEEDVIKWHINNNVPYRKNQGIL